MIALILFCVICAASFLVSIVIVKTKNLHINITGDNNTGPQKIHSSKIPRIGGVAIYITLLLLLLFLTTNLFQYDYKPILFENFRNLILISLPAVIIGLIEDLFKDISIILRLLVSIIVGIIAFYFYDVSIPSSNLNIIDQYLSTSLFFLLTILFFAGSINAINLIDGVNGLAGSISVVILFTLSHLSLEKSDIQSYHFTFFLSANILGFLLLNWFTGKIFLGDSGAYLLGTILAFATCIVLHNNNLSFFNILTLFCYPIWEITNSILRRLYNNQKIISADNKHLHSFVYLIVSKKFNTLRPFVKNFLPTFLLLPLILIGPTISLLFYNKPYLLFFLFLTIYIFLSLVYCILYIKAKAIVIISN